jgi:hypothetical protein
MGRPLWRDYGSVVYNCCWPSPAKSFSGPSPAGLIIIFYWFRFESPPTWRARSPYIYTPGTRWPSYSPRHWVPFSSPPTTRRATVAVFEPASTREHHVLAGGSSEIASERTQQKTPFLCWCGWRGITCSFVAVLSGWRRTAWQHCFPQLSYCCVTSSQTRTWRVSLLHIIAGVATWPGSHGNVFTELLPRNGCLCWLNYSGWQQTCHNILYRWTRSSGKN